MKLVTPRRAIEHKPGAEDFAVIEAETPACPAGGLLLRVLEVSLDPYIGSMLRGRHMGEAPPAPMTEPVPSAVVGEVIRSDASGFGVGDLVFTMAGAWSEVVAVEGRDARLIPKTDVPVGAYLGPLGMPGLTAWAGVTQLVRVTEGDVFLVNAAAGPVGGTAGQIARIRGADQVVGIAGGEEKGRIVTGTYGFDAAVDYRADGWRDKLSEALPEGLTVFFENVSAEMAMTALTHARPYTRGVLCGLVGAYHDETRSSHPINAGMIIGKRAQLMGLVVYDFFPRWDEFLAEVTPWVADGRLSIEEDVAIGIDSLPAHFERLMNGENTGKALVRFGEADR